MKIRFYIFFILMGLFACKNETTSLKPDDFYAKIQSEKVQLIDVRSADEIAKDGYLLGAIHLSFPDGDFEKKYKALDKNEPILVYDSKNESTAKVQSILKQDGFKVAVLDGGISAWRVANLPIYVMGKKKEKEFYTAEQFTKHINSDTLTLVDFNAEWCGPCKAMQPAIDKIKEEQKNIVKVLSVDVDTHPSISRQYETGSIPAIYLFKAGKEIYHTIGYRTEEQLMELINKYK